MENVERGARGRVWNGREKALLALAAVLGVMFLVCLIIAVRQGRDLADYERMQVGDVTITAVDRATRQPLASVSVQIDQSGDGKFIKDVTTGATGPGQMRVWWIGIDAIRVTVGAPGYADRTISLSTTPGNTVEVELDKAQVEGPGGAAAGTTVTTGAAGVGST